VVVEEEAAAATMSSRSIKTKPAVIIMDRKTKDMITLCTLMSHLIHAKRNATITQVNATDMITKLLITNARSGLSQSMNTSWNTETVWIVTSRKDTMTTKETTITTTMFALLGVSCGRV
jgi:predicted NodU family carbamoyl transferase